MVVRDHAARRGLSACFREHHGLVHGVVYDRCGDPWLAEEITAQTFEQAARRFASGHGDEVTPAWLTVVAKRRLIDHWRHVAAGSRAADRLDGVRHLHDEQTNRGHDEDVTAALESLPPRQRTVLTLRYLDDWGLDEIAGGLGISYRATESLLARARRSFVAAFESLTPDAADRLRRSR